MTQLLLHNIEHSLLPLHPDMDAKSDFMTSGEAAPKQTGETEMTSVSCLQWRVVVNMTLMQSLAPHTMSLSKHSSVDRGAHSVKEPVHINNLFGI